jgi:crotonobetainyl-CoA:carnitine CoA-transferase CaiB-like acyl-CoA transferase
MTLRRCRPHPSTASCRLGDHTFELVHEVGYTQSEIDNLVDKKSVGAA